MADRVTIRHLTPAFHHFIGELGGTTSEQARSAGQDIAGTYRLEKLFQARYRVIRYAANGRGEHTPFGLAGHPARDLYDMLTFATDALREAKRLAAQVVAICPLCAQSVLSGQPTVNGRTIHEACYLVRFEQAYQDVVTNNPNMR
jgi:hypothetical protein